jgi:hypothetical protein
MQILDHKIMLRETVSKRLFDQEHISPSIKRFSTKQIIKEIKHYTPTIP